MCPHCDETILEFLTLDHVNNDGAAHRKELGWRKGGQALYPLLKKLGFPDGFQVLCFNCNCGRGRGVCPHVKHAA